MKKGLSVLLIAAALFGFYGGAVNLNDVLACKDYWEEEGEKSTADMNKLEDGLNQLKDNEQAYLDGLDAVAEGEEALAQGEQDYADGQATLAKGEADYAAAPAKLRAGEKKLAAGKAAIAKGESDLGKLNELIDGIEQVLNNYPTFKNGYGELKQGRVDTLSPAKMKATQELLPKVLLLVGGAESDAGKKLNSAAAIMGKQAASLGYTNKDYDDFNTALENMKSGLEVAQGSLTTNKKNLSGALAAFTKEYTVQVSEDTKVTLTPLEAAKVVKTGSDDPRYPVARGILAGDGGANPGFIAGFSGNLSALGALVSALDGDELSDYQAAAAAFNISNPDNIISVYNILSNTDDSAANYQKLLSSKISDATRWTGGYEELNKKRTASDGLPYLAGGVAKIIGGVQSSGNKELIDGMNKAAAAYGVKPGNFAPVASSKLTKDLKSNSWMEDFLRDGNDIEKVFKAVLPSLKEKAANGAKTLKAGKKQVKAGQQELNKGYADYKAAPGKLAAGRAALAEGLQKLMDGRKELAAGKDKLAEYEDGEQQVRDGLATLMGTEPNGGLESILDRRSGDDDFDNGDKHLDLDEGLDAVDVGRGYQADSGELITKEITNRAIGTAAGLGAAALAVLAAILSFLKKNKGAGVLAILSAAAGGAGIAAGTSAGMEFSSIAGSAVGATPWIAFGILAGVAAVHAIAHFASKEA